MRKLGLIGGMSWVSTRAYYEHLNRIVQQRASVPGSSAALLIESLDFGTLRAMAESGNWSAVGGVLADSAKRLEQAGAGALIMCSNSAYAQYETVASKVSIPVLHIADAVGEKMAADGVTSAALLGTRPVMTESFYRRRLAAFGVELLPPELGYIDALDRIIFKELTLGKFTRDAERTLKTMITELAKAGARAVVLACTELDAVVDVDANVLPIYDSTRLHADKAAEWVLGEREVPAVFTLSASEAPISRRA